MKTLKKTIARFLIVLGVLFLFMIIAFSVSLSRVQKETKIPEKVILTADLNEIDTEYRLASPLMTSFLGKKMSVFDMVIMFRKARDDERVKAVILRTSGTKLSYSQLMDLREAVKDFQKNGKKVYAFTDTFAEAGSGTKPYYLAAACDDVYVQPSGMTGLTGFYSASMFFKGTLDKLEMEAQGGKRKDYKTYWNMFTEKEYTEAHSESVEDLINSFLSTVASDIAADRGLSEEDVKNIMQGPPLDAEEALEKKLVDGVMYRQEVENMVKKDTKNAKIVSFIKYDSELRLSSDTISPELSPHVAFIYAGGAVHRGKSDYSYEGQMQNIGSYTISKALEDAVKDEEVKGIILRVNSPGGSAVASETIWNSVIKAAEKKPLIVSMSSTAASGGYYISVGAPEIVAQPLSVTGSIGVVYGKIYMRKFWKKLGITFDSSKNGEFADLLSPLEPFSEEQSDYVEKRLDSIYDMFVSRVAEGRNLKPEDVEKIAGGRVWSGADAAEHGLVDTEGGLRKTFSQMKEKLGLKEHETILLRTFPEPPSWRDLIFGGSGESDLRIVYGKNSEIPAVFKSFSDTFSRLMPFFSGGVFSISENPVVE